MTYWVQGVRVALTFEGFTPLYTVCLMLTAHFQSPCIAGLYSFPCMVIYWVCSQTCTRPNHIFRLSLSWIVLGEEWRLLVCPISLTGWASIAVSCTTNLPIAILLVSTECTSVASSFHALLAATLRSGPL